MARTISELLRESLKYWPPLREEEIGPVSQIWEDGEALRTWRLFVTWAYEVRARTIREERTQNGTSNH